MICYNLNKLILKKIINNKMIKKIQKIIIKNLKKTINPKMIKKLQKIIINSL